MEQDERQARIIPFPVKKKPSKRYRKYDLNRNKEGSVRKMYGKVYVDFMYLGERVRESSGLPWNRENAREVRDQLDRIVVAVKAGTFRFAEVFPESIKRKYFADKERLLFGKDRTPEEVLCKDYISEWYALLKDSGRVTERTLWGYKSHIDLYLQPFFGKLTFAALNANTFDRFIAWARKQRYRKKSVSNPTLNKCLSLLKGICKSAAIEYGWGAGYNPFFGYKKLPQGDPYENIHPFSIEEQQRLVAVLPEHWKPYFRFAFCSGLRQGEQIAIKPEDIDWSKRLLHIRRAMTRDETGKPIEGTTKNRYSRRTIKLIPVMYEALEAQKKIYDLFKGNYFFCSSAGSLVSRSNLRGRVWIPALKSAGLEVRDMKQTRHSFATVGLSCGESPLWIAKVMGHRNTEMIIKVYGKYIENAGVSKDGKSLNQLYQEGKSNSE
jgi:integrase